MASKDRMQRIKDETRKNILEASLLIVQNEGWQSLSMRKIADHIEYTAPIIYEYFQNKDAILAELTRKGYLILLDKVEQASDLHDSPELKIEAMWVAYWDFAFDNKEFYQLMYGVGTGCCNREKEFPESEKLANKFRTVIQAIFAIEPEDPQDVCMKYYTYWSIIHGLISINLLRPNEGTTDSINQQILISAIKGITLSINQ